LQFPVVPGGTTTTPPEDDTNTPSTTNTNTTTIQDCLNDAIVSIRENISITDVIYLPSVPTSSTTTTTTTSNVEGPTGTMIQYVGYVHNKVDTTSNGVSAGTAAAIVGLVPTTTSTTNASSTTPTTPTHDEIQHIGKLLAMHIVAAKPQYLFKEEIPNDIIEKERDIVQQQLHNTDPNYHKKPPHIVDKIIQGKLQKYYESIVLLEQSHMIVDTNPKILSYLQQHQLSLQHYEYLSI
jgi:translation elongation factor EF-Ts